MEITHENEPGYDWTCLQPDKPRHGLSKWNSTEEMFLRGCCPGNVFFSPCHKPNIERGHDIMIILWNSGMANFMPTPIGDGFRHWVCLSKILVKASYPSGSEQPVLCDQKGTKILTYPKIWKSRIQTVRAMINNGVPGSVSIQCNLAKVGAMEPRRLVQPFPFCMLTAGLIGHNCGFHLTSKHQGVVIETSPPLPTRFWSLTSTTWCTVPLTQVVSCPNSSRGPIF